LASGGTPDAASAAPAEPGTAAEAAPPAPATGAAPAHAPHPAHAHAADHASGVHARGSDFPVPGNHVRWTPDAPLVEGMARIRTAIAALHARPGPADVVAQADAIDAAIGYLFANCQLDTEPDIALHAVLARLMAGSQALRAQPHDTAPVADMQAAIRNYEQLFDDPGPDPGRAS